MNSDLIKYPQTPPSTLLEVQSPVDLRQVIQILVERIWILLLLAVAAGAGAGYYAHRSPPKYEARAVLQVEQEEQHLISIEEVTRQDLRATEVLNTFVYNIRNSSVMLRVVTNYNLGKNPLFVTKGTNRLSDRQLARQLSGMVKARLRPETRLIEITATHKNPETAQLLANAVAQEFIRQHQEQRFRATQQANQLLYDEALKLKEKLELAERRIQNYKESHQTLGMEDRQNVALAKLEEFNQRASEAKAERLRMEADLRQMEDLSDRPEALLNIPRVMEDSAVAELRRRVAAQEAEVATLSQRYKVKHPRMIQAQQQLEDLRRTLNELALAVPRSMRSAYEAAIAREQKLESAIVAAQQEALEWDKKGIEYNVLVREVQSDRALYDSVLKRLKETDFSKSLDHSSISVVEPAELPGAPMKLPASVVGGAAFIAVFLAGLALFCLMRMANKSIQTVDEAELSLGVPVWGAIPVTNRRQRKQLPPIVLEQPASICSESFRTLRTTTSLVARDHAIHLFTSADPGEGKTFCSINHAVCQAQQGKRTLLIDLDLRKPSLGKSFSLPDDTPGVAQYLAGKNGLEELVRPGPHPNLFLLPAGCLIGNPAEELAKETLGQLLDDAVRSFDRVVLDTAPLLAVSDTLLILPRANTICLVVRTGKTPRRAILRAMELMARANVAPSGIVLNFLPQRRGMGYYYHYGADRGYGSRGTYGKDRNTLPLSSGAA